MGSPDNVSTQVVSSPMNESLREDRKRSMSAQDYDIANALLGLTSPGRNVHNASARTENDNDEHRKSVDKIGEEAKTTYQSNLNDLEESIQNETITELKTEEDEVDDNSIELRADEDIVDGTGIEQETEDDAVEENTTESIEEDDLDDECNTLHEKENLVELPWLSLSHIKVEPMLGWPSPSNSESVALREWKDPRVCSLCLTCGDDDAGIDPLNDDAVHTTDPSEEGDTINLDKSHGAGRLIPLPNGGWVHAHCAVWSSEVSILFGDCVFIGPSA